MPSLADARCPVWPMPCLADALCPIPYSLILRVLIFELSNNLISQLKIQNSQLFHLGLGT
ncbi:MAG: hypothetical protein EAZ09_25700 [Oscillatoriales cyanobacterium]|nr:MAG: hypothetical protein EAZ18_21870 [Oscillatoriales cyanobacterium]TAH14953.1 MAG: hypothetical protein EAZ09_25700 [Oscillatoriales cyanobacterium]